MNILFHIQASIRSRFLTDSARTFFLRMLGIFIQFVTLITLTNFVPNKLIGQFNYLTYVLAILCALVLLGMNNSFFQFAGKLEAIKNQYYLKTLYIKNLQIIGSVFLIIVGLYFLVRYTSEITFFTKNEMLVQHALLGALPFSIMTLNAQVIRAYDKLFASELFRSIVRFGLLFILFSTLIIINLEQHLLSFYIGALYLIAGSSTVYIFQLGKKSKPSKTKVETNIRRRDIIRISIPMSLSSMALLFMQSIDTIVLKLYYSFEIIAYYSVAMKTSILINTVLMVIATVIGPKISEYYFSNDFLNLKKILRQAVNLNFIVSFPLVIACILFSEFILSVFGEQYTLGQWPFIIILLGQMINAFCGPTGIYLNMTGKQVLFRNVLWGSLVLNLILNFILIPPYGMMGAALSTSFALVLWNLIAFYIIWKKDGIVLLPNFKRH